jgi:hypothetical protein
MQEIDLQLSYFILNTLYSEREQFILARALNLLTDLVPCFIYRPYYIVITRELRLLGASRVITREPRLLGASRVNLFG